MQSALIPVAANWRNIGIALRLRPDILQNTESRYSGDPCACLSSMVMEWLMRNYNVERFGEPTWQKLVEAVGHPAGGANMALAKEIARRHMAIGMPYTFGSTKYACNHPYDIFRSSLYYILCHGWEVDPGFIQPEVEGRGSDSPRAEPEGYHA